MNYWKFILIIVIFSACNSNKSSCLNTIDELIRNDKVFMPGRGSHQLIDKGKDSIVGGTYYFFDNNKLKSYKFFGSRNAYSYNEEYDLKGNLVHVEGNPIVYKDVKDVSKDSMFITYYFFAYNKSYFQPRMSIIDSSKIDLRLEKDTTYSNMLSASIGINTAGLSFVDLCLEVTCINNCTEQAELLTDTTKLKKYPKLDLINR